MPTALERTAACGGPAGGDAGVMVSIRYFAILREERGQEEESVRTAAATVAELYDHLRAHFSFSLPADRLRVACNGDFVSWSHPLHDDDLVVFIPPVAGG
jgi:molybdopterin synthase sulfur carrier subunit